MTATPPEAQGRAPVKVFVAAGGNAFMTDIAGWFVEAASAAGRPAELVTDRLPAADGSINLVVAPHELFELSDAPKRDLQRAAAASICVCTEQPGTKWFDLTVDAASRGLLALDINAHGVAALRRLRIAAERVLLGAAPSMRAPGSAASAPGQRPIDVLFLGGLDDRRGAVLAELSERLWQRRSEIRLFANDRPAGASTPNTVFGADKYALLASAKVLVNVHRGRSGDGPAYFEWARMIEAMANGCVVVSEPSHDHEPLLAGTHFVEARAEQMADAIDELLAQPARLQAIAEAAHDALADRLDLGRSLAPLLDRIERDVLPRIPAHVARRRHVTGRWLFGASWAAPPVRLPPFRPHRELLRSAKEIALAELAAVRRLDGARCTLRHGAPQHVVRSETPAWAAARPEVSVLVTLYNYAGVVEEALDSILATTGVAFEVIVVEDHATDDSRTVVERYLARHPDVPMVLLAKDANEGLAKARNTGFAAARAELVMVMDADNAVYPTCLRRLVDTLGRNPGAAAAYAILADFGARRGVRSALPWEVDRLCAANYIDAQAMFRRATWERLGGYRDDDVHVFGWEDWDLWLRLADSGGFAVLHPEVLGRYRVQAGSMIALTNLATHDAIAAMRRRYPALPWPALPE